MEKRLIAGLGQGKKKLHLGQFIAPENKETVKDYEIICQQRKESEITGLSLTKDNNT